MLVFLQMIVFSVHHSCQFFIKKCLPFLLRGMFFAFFAILNFSLFFKLLFFFLFLSNFLNRIFYFQQKNSSPEKLCTNKRTLFLIHKKMRL